MSKLGDFVSTASAVAGAVVVVMCAGVTVVASIADPQDDSGDDSVSDEKTPSGECDIAKLPGPDGYPEEFHPNVDLALSDSGEYALGKVGGSVVLWQDGEYQVISDKVGVFLSGVNSSGVVAGTNGDGPFIYRDGEMTRLDIPEPEEYEYVWVSGISDDGEVRGALNWDDGIDTETRALLRWDIDEPDDKPRELDPAEDDTLPKSLQGDESAAVRDTSDDWVLSDSGRWQLDDELHGGATIERAEAIDSDGAVYGADEGKPVRQDDSGDVTALQPLSANESLVMEASADGTVLLGLSADAKNFGHVVMWDCG